MKEHSIAYAMIGGVLALIVVSLSVVVISQPAEAREIEPDWTWRVYPSDRTNTGALIRMKMNAIEQRIAEIVAEREAEQQAALEAEQQYVNFDTTYYQPSYYGVQGNPDGLNSFVGVIEYDGRRETAYSSNVLYHYRTSEWTADEQGFYHDADGRYVVAASDMPQGTVFQGSMGECIVLDSGCDAGVTDYYTNWR